MNIKLIVALVVFLFGLYSLSKKYTIVRKKEKPKPKKEPVKIEIQEEEEPNEEEKES